MQIVTIIAIVVVVMVGVVVYVCVSSCTNEKIFCSYLFPQPLPTSFLFSMSYL